MYGACVGFSGTPPIQFQLVKETVEEVGLDLFVR